MAGLLRLQEKVQRQRRGEKTVPELSPELLSITRPSVPRLCDPARPAGQDEAQLFAAEHATEAEAPAAAEESSPEVIPGDFTAASHPVTAPDFEAALREVGVADLPTALSGGGPPLVPADRHLGLAKRLRELGDRQYVSAVASHWLAGTSRKGKDPAEVEHFEVTTLLRKIGPDSRTVAWCVRLLPGEFLPSLTTLFAGADWQEREQFDLVGVRFAGHPDLRRLMMAEDYPNHPLRRDFAVDAPYAPWR
jgi:NADH:ubiquinone oxidoreductase subunit C